MFDLEGFFASPVSIPHVVDLLSVLAPLDDGGRVASDGAHDLDVLPDPSNLFHFLFVGLRRTCKTKHLHEYACWNYHGGQICTCYCFEQQPKLKSLQAPSML